MVNNNAYDGQVQGHFMVHNIPRWRTKDSMTQIISVSHWKPQKTNVIQSYQKTPSINCSFLCVVDALYDALISN